MQQLVFQEPLETYLSELMRFHCQRLKDFYYGNQLYIDLYSMKEPLLIQKMNGYPDSEFCLTAGQRKNYLMMVKLRPIIEIPAYGYSSPLEKIAEKEIQAVREGFREQRKIAIYIEHAFKGFF